MLPEHCVWISTEEVSNSLCSSYYPDLHCHWIPAALHVRMQPSSSMCFTLYPPVFVCKLYSMCVNLLNSYWWSDGQVWLRLHQLCLDFVKRPLGKGCVICLWNICIDWTCLCLEDSKVSMLSSCGKYVWVNGLNFPLPLRDARRHRSISTLADCAGPGGETDNSQASYSTSRGKYP